jgi:hypothetical protein
MNEQGEQIKKNFLQQWIRLAFVVLYIIVFGLLWRFIAILLLVVIILQSLHRVIAAENNSNLLAFSEGLGNFLLKVLQYVLYLSDDKPIDFDAFFSQKNKNPESAAEEAAQPKADVAAEAVNKTANTGHSTEAVNTQRASEDDVFADISFTEKTDGPAESSADSENNANKDAQPKKPD